MADKVRFKPRGRFSIVCVFDDSLIRITSDPTRSLPPDELVSQLRLYADKLDKAIEAGRA